MKILADDYVSISTMQHAVKLLERWDLVVVVAGRGCA